ncbi:MAG: hypothetical protein ACI9B8_001346 [Sulfitobacter sp.]|jgi:hypothetical protein
MSDENDKRSTADRRADDRRHDERRSYKDVVDFERRHSKTRREGPRRDTSSLDSSQTRSP